MKTKPSFNPLLPGRSMLLAAALATHCVDAANWFWDGGTVNFVGTGNAASAGGAGNWNTTLTNWDPSPSGSAFSAWNSIHTANFGGTAGAVAVGAGITANGLTFSTVGYSFTGSAITLATGSTITSVGNGTQTFTGGLATADNILRFTNSNTTPAFSNGTLFTAAVGISGASTSVQINGASTNSPVVLNGTLTYGGTTTVAANTAFGLSGSTISGLANGSISMGANSTLLRSGGSLGQATLDKVATTTNTFTIVANNAGTASALNLTNFPNASLATWDNAGTQTFAFTGAITAGSNGYRFGSSRAGNTINIGGTNTTGAVTANTLTGTAGLTFVSGTTGSNPLNLWGANTYSGNTINNVAGRAISINHPLAMQNSAIDTSGAGTYVLGTGSSGTNGSGATVVTTPTIGGLTGSKTLLTNVIAATGYNTMTSLTLNPGTGSTHTYSGVIANSTAGLALSKSGAGIQILSGLNTFAGNVTVSGGTLAAAVSASGGNSALGTVVSTRTINVNTGGTLRADSSNIFNPTFSTPATSLPALNIAGGTMTNGGPAFNSALGNITLAAGTLTATTGSPIGTGMSGEGWGSWNLNGTVTSTGTSTISSTAPGGIPITLSATATNSYVTTFDVQSGTLAASAIFGDVTRVGNETVSGLAKTGAGTMVLSGINTYTGNTAINAGVLGIATKDALPGYNVNGRYSVAAGATLAVQNGVLDSEITAILGTTNFVSGANLGFDTAAGSRSVALNLADTANGPLGIVKLGANTLTLSGTNTHTGGTSVLAGTLNVVPSISSLPGWNVNGGFSIASGASLIIPNSVTESEVTTILGTTNLASGASLLFDTSAGNRTYASAITNSASGLINIGKIGANTLTLSGASTYTGNTSVTDGALTITGSLGGSATTSNLTYGTAATTATVNVSSGANLTLATLQGANNLSAVSVYNQTGGSVVVGAPGSTAESAYAASSGSGYFNLSGGSVTVHSRFTAALNGTGGGKGVTRVGGGAGSATLTVGELLAVTRGPGAIGELTVLPNGTTTFDGTGINNMLVLGANANQAALLNIAGGTFSSAVKPVAFGNGTVTNSSIGLINVGAGTLELGSSLLVNVIASGTNKGFVNFAGGTVKLLATTSGNLLLPASNGGFDSLANTIFGPVSNSTTNLDGTGAASAVNGIVGTSQNFAGGVTIDTGAFLTTVSAPLVAPAGGGVAQANISITDPGAGYAAPPTVLFSNPAAANKTPAAGYALVNGGLLAGIVITSPGAYDSSDTVTVTLTGGGATTPATVASIAGTSLTANTSGGLVKTGSGVLTLSAANTYTGATAVNTGSLNLTGSLASNLTVASNAGLLGEGSTTGSLVFSGGSSFLGFDPATPASLAAASANATGAVVSVLPSTVPTIASGIVVLGASGGITGAIGSEFVYTGRGTLSYNVGNTQLLLDTAPVSLAWRGNDGTNPTFWDLNATTNWDSGVPEKFLTGDGALFDDTAASFVVDINAANVFPGNITFNNTTNNYSLQGAFGIYGPGTPTKNGTGTTVIHTSNAYTGVTTVNAGVLNIRNANALGDVIAGTSVASGSALEIQGGITTAAEALSLNGAGVLGGGALRSISGNNAWGAPVALASASTIGVDADTLTLSSLTGAFGLTKVGSGTLNITGATAVTSTTVEAGTLYMGAQTGASTTTTLGAGNPVTLNGSSSLVIRRTNTGGSDVTGAIGGTGSLALIGDNLNTLASGDFLMNIASTYSGGTTITGARANITVSGAALGTGLVTTGANGQVFLQTSGLTLANNFSVGGLGWNENSGFLGAIRLNATTLSGNIDLTSNTRITGAGSSTLSGIISGGFGLDFFEDSVFGTVTLSGNNTYTGTTVINSMGAAPATLPNLVVGSATALGTTAGGTIVVGTGSTTTGTQLTLADGITVTDETLTLDATAAGYRASLVTAGTATWDGNVITAGTGGFVGFYANGAGLTVGSSDTDTVTGTTSLVLRGTGTGTVNSTLNLGVRGLIKTDASTWTITSNNNDFTGTPAMASGILSVGTIADSGTNSALGAGTTLSIGQNSATAGRLQFTGASGGSSNRALFLNNGTTGGAGVIENTVPGQLLALSGALTVNTPASACSLTLTGDGNGLMSGGIVGTPFLSINKSGAGTWTLSGTTNHTGTTSVTAGTLTLSGTNVVNSATSVGKFTVNGATAVANIEGTYNVANGNGDAFFEIRGGGTVNFSGTASLTGATGAGFRVGEASAGTLNVTTGLLNYVPTATSNLVVGRTSGANGTLNISGGTVTVSGLGGVIIANDATTTGTVTIGGTGTLDISTATFRIGGNATATAATLNLNTGGTLKLGTTPTSTGTSRIFNFDGGTLQASADIAVSGLTAVNVKAGGAVFNTTSGNISIGQALLEDGVSTGGGLTKNGINTLTLNGANTYTGATLVSGGVLALAGGSQASPITVDNGASLGFTLGSGASSNSAVTFNAGSTVTITGTPTLPSYTLMTTSAAFTGITPVLSAPIAGYELKVETSNTLKLVQMGYGAWALLNGAGVNLDDDHDGDGVSNGVEYFLGGPNGNTTGFTALPGVVNNAGTLSVTWPKGASYAGAYTTDFVVETSATLSGPWTAETIGSGNITDTPNPGGSVKYTFPGGPAYSGKNFARLRVTGP